jgi:hypothetical protein
VQQLHFSGEHPERSLRFGLFSSLGRRSSEAITGDSSEIHCAIVGFLSSLAA